MKYVPKIIFVVLLCTLLNFLIVITFNSSTVDKLILPSRTYMWHARHPIAKTCLTFASDRNNVGFAEKNNYVYLF